MTGGIATTLLPGGTRAEITADPLVPGGFELSIDGSPQSHVRLDDPGALFYDYVRRMGSVIDRIRMPGAPITAIHLGAGALTLPRYVQATRPGSAQHVVELVPGLVGFVTDHLPLPAGTDLALHEADAAQVVPLLPRGRADLVVADLYRGTTTPPHLVTPAFFTAVSALLAPDGVLLVNVADDDGAPALTAQLAVLERLFPCILLLGPASVLQDARAGNAVVVATGADTGRSGASPGAGVAEWIPTLQRAGPHPGLVIEHRKDGIPCADASR